MVFLVRSIPETSVFRNSQAPAQTGAMGEQMLLGCTRPTATSWIRGTKVNSSLRSISRVSPGLRRTGGRCLSREAPANPAPSTTTRAPRWTLTLRSPAVSPFWHGWILPDLFWKYIVRDAGFRRAALQNARPNVDCTDRQRLGRRRSKGCQVRKTGNDPPWGLERDRFGDEGGNGSGGYRPWAHRKAHQPPSGKAGTLRSVRALDLGAHLVLGVRGSGRRRVHGAPGVHDGQRPASSTTGGSAVLHR